MEKGKLVKGKALTRKFGLFSATCMVIGTIIGSGIFIKSEEIAHAVGSNLWFGVFAWVLGGGIMLAFAYTFSRLAQKHEKVNGLIDYSEAVVGPRYGYALGWFMSTIYGPALMAFLAHATARFTVALIGFEELCEVTQTYVPVSQLFSPQTFMFAGLYLVLANVINMLVPKISIKLNISTTLLRIIPVVAMGVIGTIVGLINGGTVQHLQESIPGAAEHAFLAATFATAFAFAGWESTMALNSEVKNSKRILPIALLLGTSIVVALYALYYIGMFGAVDTETLSAAWAVRQIGGTMTGFQNIFGAWAGPVLFGFIIISCFGALNGFTMAHHRGMYALGRRGRGVVPTQMANLDGASKMPVNSGLVSLLLSAVWLFIFGGHQAGWWVLPVSGLAVVYFNVALFPILIGMMVKQKDLNLFDRFVMPAVSIAGGVLMMVAAWLVVADWLLVFGIIIVASLTFGMFFYNGIDRKKTDEGEEELPQPV